MDHFFFKSFWICHNITSALCFGFFICLEGLWDPTPSPQGIQLHPLDWKAKFQPLDHQESPWAAVLAQIFQGGVSKTHSVRSNIDWNTPHRPGTIDLHVILQQEVLVRNIELFQLQEFGKGQKEMPGVLPPPRILSGIHLGWAMCAPPARTLSQIDWPGTTWKLSPSP